MLHSAENVPLGVSHNGVLATTWGHRWFVHGFFCFALFLGLNSRGVVVLNTGLFPQLQVCYKLCLRRNNHVCSRYSLSLLQVSLPFLLHA